MDGLKVAGLVVTLVVNWGIHWVGKMVMMMDMKWDHNSACEMD